MTHRAQTGLKMCASFLYQILVYLIGEKWSLTILLISTSPHREVRCLVLFRVWSMIPLPTSASPHQEVRCLTGHRRVIERLGETAAWRNIIIIIDTGHQRLIYIGMHLASVLKGVRACNKTIAVKVNYSVECIDTTAAMRWCVLTPRKLWGGVYRHQWNYGVECIDTNESMG